MKQVICIGSASKDIFFPTDEMKIIDNGGDIEAQKLMAFEYGAKVQIEDRFEAPGGCAANSTQGLARLGVDAACYARVGNDGDGRWVMDNLKKENVGTNLIQIDEARKTDLSCILVNRQDGERTIFFNRDANEKLEVNVAELEAEWVFVSALNGAWHKNMDHILRAVSQKGIRVAFNPGQANIKEDWKKVREFVSKVELLILNRDEATEIVGKRNDHPIFLLNELKNLGPKIVVITDGRNGTHLQSEHHEILFAPASGDQPVDSTGAGDAFSAAFLASYIQKHSLEECLRRGTANGGNVVRYYGAKEGLLTEKEIEEKAKIIAVKKI